jgi:hypothetical protein
MVLFVERFFVSMVVLFIAAISISLSVSCFCVFSVNTPNSFFIFSFLASCLLNCFYLLFGEGDGSSSSSGGGLASALFGICLMSSSPSMSIMGI